MSSIRTSPSRARRLVALALGIGALASCGDRNPTAPIAPASFRAVIGGAVDTTLTGAAYYVDARDAGYVVELVGVGTEPRRYLTIFLDPTQGVPGTYTFGSTRYGYPRASFGLGCCDDFVYELTSERDGTVRITQNTGQVLRGSVQYRVVGTLPGHAFNADTISVSADFAAIRSTPGPRS